MSGFFYFSICRNALLKANCKLNENKKFNSSKTKQ